jgi:beta-glucosidase
VVFFGDSSSLTLRTLCHTRRYILSDAGATAFVGSTQVGKPGEIWHESNKTFGHGFATSPSDAAIQALTAGLDLELTCCGAPAVLPTISDSVKAGKIAESVVDTSLQRTLPIRFELGQLDGATPAARARVPDNAYARLNRKNNVSTPAMVKLAEIAAKKAIILLKNLNKTLPLSTREFSPSLTGSAAKGKTICMFGPNSNSTQAQEAGYVNSHPRFITTPFVGVRAITDNVVLVPTCNTTRCVSYDTEAVQAALAGGLCNALVAVIGLTAYSNPGSHLEPERAVDNGNACGCIRGDAVEGECCDRQDIQLPGAQLQLIQQAAAAAQAGGRPFILVSVNAGQLDLRWAENSPAVGAILNAPYLGMTAGTAIAATLFGDNNPGARLVRDTGPVQHVCSLADHSLP